MTLLESDLVQKARDSVHLNQMLDVLFVVQTLLCNLKLPVAIHVPPTPAFAAARFEAAAADFEKGDNGEETVARVEVLSLLDFGL